jgi:hypothetical protein
MPRQIGPVGPLPRDTEGATLQLADNQSVDAGYASFLEDFEAVATKRVEGVTDFSPAQR